jgi:hypothetical protein
MQSKIDTEKRTTRFIATFSNAWQWIQFFNNVSTTFPEIKKIEKFVPNSRITNSFSLDNHYLKIQVLITLYKKKSVTVAVNKLLGWASEVVVDQLSIHNRRNTSNNKEILEQIYLKSASNNENIYQTDNPSPTEDRPGKKRFIQVRSTNAQGSINTKTEPNFYVQGVKLEPINHTVGKAVILFKKEEDNPCLTSLNSVIFPNVDHKRKW